MDVTQLPFNRFVGIESCEKREGGIFELPAANKFLNHVGTVHASALFGLAEASSGQFLADNLGADEKSVLPILRRADIKYRKPAEGYVYSKGVYREADWDSVRESLQGGAVTGAGRRGQTQNINIDRK